MYRVMNANTESAHVKKDAAKNLLFLGNRFTKCRHEEKRKQVYLVRYFACLIVLVVRLYLNRLAPRILKYIYFLYALYSAAFNFFFNVC